MLIESVYSWVLTHIRVRPKYTVALALFLITCWLILNPRGERHIRFSGDTLDFDLPAFHHCNITFLSPVMVKSYTIVPDQKSTNPNSPIPSVSITRAVNSEVPFLMVENTNNTQTATTSNQLYSVHVLMTPSLNCEITAVSIDEHVINLKLFFNQQLKSHSEFTRLRFIRKDIADTLYRINDKGSNWILTFMSLGIVYLISNLLFMEARLHLSSERRFDKYLILLLNIKDIKERKQRNEALDKYTAFWAKSDRWFRFLQALGPALGFILTVSSLVQALHPSSLLGTRDLDGFLSGIHVAMISTFLGLLIRIVALEAARVNDELLIRADMRLAENDEHL